MNGGSTRCALWGAACAMGVMCFLASAGIAASHASAQDEEQAQAHFRVGRAYYDTGRFADAAREFQRAYELSQRHALLYNVFVAHRDAGNLPDAVIALRRYLELVPDAAERDALAARLASMERLAEQQARGGGPPPESTATPIPSAPRSSGGSGGGDGAGGGGGGGPWMPGFIVAGVGAAAVVASIITGVLALDARGSLGAMCNAERECPEGFEATRDGAALLAGLTDGLMFGGLAIATLGVVLAFVISDGAQETRVACGLGGCSLRTQF